MMWRNNVSLTIPTTRRAPATTASHAATRPRNCDITRADEGVGTGLRASTIAAVTAARTVIIMNRCWNVIQRSIPTAQLLFDRTV